MALAKPAGRSLGQLAHQHIAIARVFAGNPDPPDRVGIATAAEGRHVPGGAGAVWGFNLQYCSRCETEFCDIQSTDFEGFARRLTTYPL